MSNEWLFSEVFYNQIFIHTEAIFNRTLTMREYKNNFTNIPKITKHFIFVQKGTKGFIKLSYFPIKFWKFVIFLHSSDKKSSHCTFAASAEFPDIQFNWKSFSTRALKCCLAASGSVTIKIGDKHMAFLIKEYFKGDLSCKFWANAFKNLRQSFLNFNFTSLETWSDFKFSLVAVPSFIGSGGRHVSAFVKSSLISLYGRGKRPFL